VEEEFKHIADYFESWELAELLRLDTMDLIRAFEDDVLDKLTELEELMEYNSD
jgi:hypothetical protein